MARKEQALKRTELHPRVAAGGLAGVLATVVLWILSLGHVNPPANVAAAITTLFVAAGGYLVKLDDGLDEDVAATSESTAPARHPEGAPKIVPTASAA